MEPLTYEKLSELGFHGERLDYLYSQLNWYLSLVGGVDPKTGLTVDVARRIAIHKILTKSSRFAKKHFRALRDAIDKYYKRINRQKKKDAAKVLKKIGGVKTLGVNLDEYKPKTIIALAYERVDGIWVMLEYSKGQYFVHDRIGEITSEDGRYKFVYYGIKKDQDGCGNDF